MSDKDRRQKLILDVIRDQSVSTQDALSNALREHGVGTTQSTLSKDMRELRVMKIPNAGGGFQYGTPNAAAEQASRIQGEQLLGRELSDFVTTLDVAGNTLVVKTLTGHAQGVCEAIDQAGWEEVVGTIAGDNTIFVLCRSEGALAELRARIEEMRSA
jgi:transcriptional regulator of arginine metabolism